MKTFLTLCSLIIVVVIIYMFWVFLFITPIRIWEKEFNKIHAEVVSLENERNYYREQSEIYTQKYNRMKSDYKTMYSIVQKYRRNEALSKEEMEKIRER